MHACANLTRAAQELTFTPKKGNTQKILVWVLTSPSTHDTKAKAVARTWGPLCVVSKANLRLT